MAYRVVLDKKYPAASSYRGPAERGVAEFRGPAEQVAPAGLVGMAAAKLVEATRLQGGTSLALVVEADTSPTFWTGYRITYTLHASPFPWWYLVAVLAVLGLVALAAWQVSQVDWSAPGLAIWGLVVAGVVVLLAGGLIGGRRK